ncbi:MAG: protein kinase [Polyangiaceae bacterium]|nr:protein kinase [Polyangiaceae bacterium]
MADQTLREGAVFHEKYQVIRSLAQGGMGAVYEVIHLETNRRRALKVMLPSVLGSEELRNRFRAEARVASGIESEHIVETFDAGIDRASGMPFLVMELLKGQELADVLKSQGAFPPDRALPLIAQVSRTLDKTHAARVVHRDLKPENLFVSTREDGTLHVKILDFGIAKVVAEGQNAGQTRSLGTPLYMAPEQFDGSAPISAQTDLFALAHITYTMLVGVPYWAEEMESSPSLYGFLMAMQNPDSEPPTQRAARRRAQLPPGFDAWFARATAKRAQDRFRSGAEQQAAPSRCSAGWAAPRLLSASRRARSQAARSATRAKAPPPVATRRMARPAAARHRPATRPAAARHRPATRPAAARHRPATRPAAARIRGTPEGPPPR